MDAWEDVQKTIWACESCHGHPRVSCNTRQHTQAPNQRIKLLLVGIAPPYTKQVQMKTVAKSATNDPSDNLRRFVLDVLGLPWHELLARGLFLIHSVKCAIIPKDRHQNPPSDVVDVCAPPHFGKELQIIQPTRIVAFGKAPYRALLKVPGRQIPKNLGVSKSVATLVMQTRGGLEVLADGWNFRLHVSPFPLTSGKPNTVAAQVLRDAAQLSGILS